MSDQDMFALVETLLRQCREQGLPASENAVILLQTVLHQEIRQDTPDMVHDEAEKK